MAQITGIHCPHSRYGITLDAGDLNQSANRIAGQTQMVLHSNFCSIFYLIQVLPVKLSQCGGCHRAGSANLCLTAAFCAGDRGVALGEAADNAGGGKPPDDLFVGKTSGFLNVF